MPYFMNKKIVFECLRLIPKGKVVSYKQLAQSLGIGSARLVSYYLRQNQSADRFIYPCFKVVRSDGSLADGYLFGGKLKQKQYLQQDGVVFYKDKVVDSCFYEFNSVLKSYFCLLIKYGFPGPWPWFGKAEYNFEEIIISSVLTQNTSWPNVEKSVVNLRLKGICSLAGILESSESVLLNCIKPSGFYTRKAQTLKYLALLIHNFKRNYFQKNSIEKVRQKLLTIYGIGQETADTVLLYAFDRLIFPIDAYTRKFVGSYLSLVSLSSNSYLNLQSFFQQHLPRDLEVYKNMHALITAWGKDN